MKTKAIFGILAIALTLAIQAEAQSFLTNGLMAYFPFDGNANDASGNGNNGVVFGATLGTDRFGNAGSAYQFNGSNAVITVSGLSSTNLTGLTLSVWVNAFAYPSLDGPIINKWRGFSYSLEDYSLTLTTGGLVTFANGRHGTGYGALPNHCTITTTNHLSLGHWYHIVVTLDSAGTGTLWVNAILSIQDNILQLLPPATEPPRIGISLYTSGSPYNGAIEGDFNGLIDDIRVYNRALSPSEVQQLYQFESVSIGPFLTLLKAVQPSFSSLSLGTNYQLQVSSDMNNWTNQGSPFSATNTVMVYPQYFDVANWSQLFFRLQVAP
jgi:hypothetical protein